MAKHVLILMSLCLLGAPADSTLAADLYGQVLRSSASDQSSAQISRYRGRDAEVQPEHYPDADPRLYAVIYLTGENVPPPIPETDIQSMTQIDKSFSPPVIAISVGSSVSFPNADPFFHNVFSYSTAKKFDLGRYPAGETREVLFDQPGTIKVYCDIHYSMRAYIHVLNSSYYTVSDKNRSFRITGIEPGTYTLHVWQESLPELTRPITIESDSTYTEIY